MFYVINFGVQSVVISASDMELALKHAWQSMVQSHDERPDHALEVFKEEVGRNPSEDILRAYKQSCRDFGYLWTDLKIVDAYEVSCTEFNRLRSEENLKEINW